MERVPLLNTIYFVSTSSVNSRFFWGVKFSLPPINKVKSDTPLRSMYVVTEKFPQAKLIVEYLVFWGRNVTIRDSQRLRRQNVAGAVDHYRSPFIFFYFLRGGGSFGFYSNPCQLKDLQPSAGLTRQANVIVDHHFYGSQQWNTVSRSMMGFVFLFFYLTVFQCYKQEFQF